MKRVERNVERNSDGAAAGAMRSGVKRNSAGRGTCRRGQLQALEPVMITIILVIIIGVALIFYVRINDTEGAGDRAVLRQEDDLRLLSVLSSMPELSCPPIEGLPKNCIDLEKARQFQQLTRDENVRVYYSPVLGATNITIEMANLTLARQPSINIYQNMKSENRVAIRTYAVAFDPVTRNSYFATIVIERERR